MIMICYCVDRSLLIGGASYWCSVPREKLFQLLAAEVFSEVLCSTAEQ